MEAKQLDMKALNGINPSHKAKLQLSKATAVFVRNGVPVPASAGSPTQHLQVQVPQARPSPFPPLTRRNDLQDTSDVPTWRLRRPRRWAFPQWVQQQHTSHDIKPFH